MPSRLEYQPLVARRSSDSSIGSRTGGVPLIVVTPPTPQPPTPSETLLDYLPARTWVRVDDPAVPPCESGPAVRSRSTCSRDAAAAASGAQPTGLRQRLKKFFHIGSTARPAPQGRIAAPIADRTLSQLIHSIQDCPARDGALLARTLARRLGVELPARPRNSEAVLDLLRGRHWVDQVQDQTLRLADLLPAIGQATDLPTRQALVDAVEGAITVLRQHDPGFDRRIDPRLAAPAPPLRMAPSTRGGVASLGAGAAS